MNNYLLYIDPGTGSMLFSLFIGISMALTFGVKYFISKFKFILTRGKISDNLDCSSIPYVIFSDHKRYWNIFKPICDEFEKREIDIVYFTASEDDPALNCSYKHVKTEFLGTGNKPFGRLNMLNADILIATTPNLDVYQWKRSKGVKCYVHIPHYVGDFSDYRMFGLDYYDAVLASGENQIKFIRKIEELRPSIKHKEVVLTGSICLDNLKKKVDSSNKIQNTRPVVLLAPSWGKSGILSRYGEKFLDELIKTGYQIIVRPHPQSYSAEKKLMESLESKYTSVEWNKDNDNFDVLTKADVLITDFSGIIFDYSLVFGKPVIYADTKFDTLPYDADWLDEKIWSLRAVEKIGVKLEEKDFGNLKQLIDGCMNNQTLENKRNEIINECWAEIGKGAENTVSWLIKKHSEI